MVIVFIFIRFWFSSFRGTYHIRSERRMCRYIIFRIEMNPPSFFVLSAYHRVPHVMRFVKRLAGLMRLNELKYNAPTSMDDSTTYASQSNALFHLFCILVACGIHRTKYLVGVALALTSTLYG